MITTLPRGLRNNNPGNINFAHQPGAVLEPVSKTVPNPRFAKFPTIQDGVRALSHQLELYFSRGTNTVEGIIHKWAPPTENATNAYITYVARSMGVSPTDVLKPTIPTLAQLVMAISHFECGASLPYNEAHVETILTSASV